MLMNKTRYWENNRSLVRFRYLRTEMIKFRLSSIERQIIEMKRLLTDIME